MNAADPLAEFYAASPRHSAALGGRAGVHAQVDSALNELEVPATLDQDGDWKLATDIGPFLLIVDKESSDIVAVQTIQSMERKVKNSADEMHVLMALNFEARGIARFGVVKDNDQNLLVLTARLAPDNLSTESIQGMLSDCFRLSRRVDELLGNEPQQPPAQPGGWQAADAALAQAEGQGGPQAPPQAAPSPPPVGSPEPAPAAPAQPAPAQPQQPAPAQPQQVPAGPAQPAAPQQALPPANWYPDPHGQARLRYWDGQRWTEHVAN